MPQPALAFTSRAPAPLGLVGAYLASPAISSSVLAAPRLPRRARATNDADSPGPRDPTPGGQATCRTNPGLRLPRAAGAPRRHVWVADIAQVPPYEPQGLDRANGQLLPVGDLAWLPAVKGVDTRESI